MNHFHFREIDSTNSWLKQNLSRIPEGGIVWVTADTQTMGRGRHGRSWASPAGEGLWMTYGYWSPGDVEAPLSLGIAEKIVGVLHGIGLQCTVKPPNDILVNGKKLCGILCETVWEGDKAAHVIGIGINVRSSPQGLDQPVTSLWEEGVMLEVGELFKLIQNEIKNNILTK